MRVGVVESAADLPFSGCEKGDVWYVKNIEHYWTWDGRIWQDLGEDPAKAGETNERQGAGFLRLE